MKGSYEYITALTVNDTFVRKLQAAISIISLVKLHEAIRREQSRLWSRVITPFNHTNVRTIIIPTRPALGRSLQQIKIIFCPRSHFTISPAWSLVHTHNGTFIPQVGQIGGTPGPRHERRHKCLLTKCIYTYSVYTFIFSMTHGTVITIGRETRERPLYVCLSHLHDMT